MIVGKVNSIVTNGFLREEDVLEFIKKQNGFNLYIVTDYEVFLGTVRDGQILLDRKDVPSPVFIQEVRVFIQEIEIKITRTAHSFVWRKRQDLVGKDGPVDYIDECHKLWGSVTENNTQFLILKEDRGTTISVPKTIELHTEEIGLVFRKYISFHDKDFHKNQPFSYQIIDERLVKYCDFEKGVYSDD